MSADNLYRLPVGYERIKTEHTGPKNGGGAWMTRTRAKQTAKHKRRQTDKGATAVAEMPRDAATIYA